MKRRTFDKQFKQMIVELLQSGISANQLSEEYDLNINMIYRWPKKLTDNQTKSTDKKELTPEQKRLKELEAQLRDVTLERDILKKAVSIHQ